MPWRLSMDWVISSSLQLSEEPLFLFYLCDLRDMKYAPSFLVDSSSVFWANRGTLATDSRLSGLIEISSSQILFLWLLYYKWPDFRNYCVPLSREFTIQLEHRFHTETHCWCWSWPRTASRTESALPLKTWPSTNCKECETYIQPKVIADSHRLGLDRSEN